MAPLKEESDAEAAEATRKWYQKTWGKIVVGVTTTIIVGAVGWLWSHLEAQMRTVSTGADHGVEAKRIAEDNREMVQTLSDRVDQNSREIQKTRAAIIEQLDSIQTSLDRNRDEYERSVDQLRKDIRQIERHHYPGPRQ